MPGANRTTLTTAAAVLVAAAALTAAAGDAREAVSPTASSSPAESAADRGYRVLRTKSFLPPDFDDGVFDKLWTLWPEDLRAKAAVATPQERRRLTFERYGLHEPPDAPPGYDGPAFGYVDDGADGWVMNCFACHAGRVPGVGVVPGAPNTDIDLQSLVEDVRAAKLTQLKPLTHLDLGSLKVPLGGTRGTTNSVVFGILLDGLRRPDMTVDLTLQRGPLVHHDMDAPAWWNVHKKSKLYVDAFAPKNHRILMQFILIPKNDRDTVYSWEDDFRDVLAYINSLEPPAYPWDIDEPLAAQGKAVFEQNCAECHGTYAETQRSEVRGQASPAIPTADLRLLTPEAPTSLPSPSGEGPGVRGVLTPASPLEPVPQPSTLNPQPSSYPQRVIPIADLGTDPVRLGALSVKHREHLKSTWMTDYGRDETIADPGGYVAPPLDGVWAAAPYFHNGSVPTLWHVLHPDQRPKVWRRDRTADGYDHTRIGLAVEELAAPPEDAVDPSTRRELFDTSQFGKSAAGHDYPDALTEEDKRAVLEYLKTL